MHVAVAHVDVRAESLEGRQVHVDGARSEVVPAGQGHRGLPAARQERPEDGDGGAHPADQLVRGVRPQPPGHLDVQDVTSGDVLAGDVPGRDVFAADVFAADLFPRGVVARGASTRDVGTWEGAAQGIVAVADPAAEALE